MGMPVPTNEGIHPLLRGFPNHHVTFEDTTQKRGNFGIFPFVRGSLAPPTAILPDCTVTITLTGHGRDEQSAIENALGIGTE